MRGFPVVIGYIFISLYILIYTQCKKKSIAPLNFFWSVRKLAGLRSLVRVRESVRLDHAARRAVPAYRALPLCKRVSWSRTRCGDPSTLRRVPRRPDARRLRALLTYVFFEWGHGAGTRKAQCSRVSWLRPVPELFAALMRLGPAGPGIPRDEVRPRTKKRQRKRCG